MKLVYDGAFKARDDDGVYWYHLTVESDRAIDDMVFAWLQDRPLEGGQEEVADQVQSRLPGLPLTVSVKYPDGTILKSHRP